MQKHGNRKYHGAALVLAGTMALAACNSAQNTEAEAASATQPSETTAPEPSTGANADVQTDLISFEYSYPASGNALLDAHLGQEQESSLAALRKDAAEAKADAEKNDYPYRTFGTRVQWTKAGQSQHLISMYALGSYYTGGAHPNNGFIALLWDTTAGEEIEFSELFTSREKMQAALGDRICDPIDAIREERRGMKKPANTNDSFWDCPALSEVQLIPANDGSGPFREIAVRIGPYVAGPYAEGNFEFALPVDRAFIAALKPELGSEFALPE